MDVEELSMIGPVVDLTSVDSIHRKRIVAFVNHFIINTASFLNRLSCTVDSKLLMVDHRLQKLEASIILLESKLSSIPGLDAQVPVKDPVIVESVKEESVDAKVLPVPAMQTSEDVPSEAESVDEVKEASKPAAMDESLLKYVKMLQFGVPMPAVKLKMQQEGLSPEQQSLVLPQ